jgi:tellurite methyltransferase
MKKLPSNVSVYNKTPIFTEKTVPKALLKNHNTKAGTWGLLTALKGEIEYFIEDQEKVTLSTKLQGIIEPEITHYIKPIGEVSFFIEFCKS